MPLKNSEKVENEKKITNYKQHDRFLHKFWLEMFKSQGLLMGGLKLDLNLFL